MGCPDEAEVSEFAVRALAPGAAARIEAHMADCDGCRALVFALASRGEPSSDGPGAGVQRIGRFEVLDVLGQGAMGVVYQARDPELDRLVAVKVCRAHAKLDVDGEDRLRREAQALARLAHPNVVTIHEIGPSDGRTYVAMEFVDGVTLDRWLVEPRQPRAILDLLAAAGRGLAAAHRVGLVHRDVKPSNILVSAGGVAKVSDFGLVRIPQQHYQRALALKETALGPDARDVAAARLNLGVVLHTLGKYDEAGVAEQRAYESWKRSIGPEHPDVAHALTNLGENAYAQGKYAEARGFHERALAIYLNALGPDQRDVAAANNNLGNAVLAAGDIAGARVFHQRALVTYEKLDPNHADVAATLSNLGSDAISEDKFAAAEHYYRRAIPIFEKALGPDHPDLATGLNNLGMTLSLQGKYAEARPFYERAVAVVEKALGPDHPDLGQALTGLGTVLFELGELGGARTAVERAVHISEVGTVAPGELGAARFALAKVLWAQNVSRPRALELARQARDEFSAVGAAPELQASEAWLRSHR